MVYRQLSTEERYQIAALRRQKLSSNQIAAALRRHPSTIAREVQRNATPYDGAYRPSYAKEMTSGRRRRSRRNARYEAIHFAPVAALLELRWSPEQIVGRRRLEGLPVMSHETIYLWIRRDKRRGGSLWTHLRHGRKRCRKRYRGRDSRGRLPGKRPIQDRPKLVAERKRFGDWEADTVHGKGKPCIATAVERKSGIVRIGPLPRATVEYTNARLIELLSHEHHPVRTITSDNGVEFHGYKRLEQALDTTIYFATPHHAWERGTNENTNGLIRQFLPKGTSLARLSQARCTAIASQLNHRPRKRLGFLSPLEVYHQSVLPPRRSVASCGKLFGSCPRKRPIG
jgi:transposase, IS30 family